MKAGTAKILDAGLRQARAQIKHNINAQQVKQCLLTSQATVASKQAISQARGARKHHYMNTAAEANLNWVRKQPVEEIRCTAGENGIQTYIRPGQLGWCSIASLETQKPDNG